MTNISENTLPTWLFISNGDDCTHNDCSLKLLDWSGEKYCKAFSATDNILNALMVEGHRLSKESVVELIALLGSSFGSNPYPTPSARELFTDCIMILSRYLGDLPKE